MFDETLFIIIIFDIIFGLMFSLSYCSWVWPKTSSKLLFSLFLFLSLLTGGILGFVVYVFVCLILLHNNHI